MKLARGNMLRHILARSDEGGHPIVLLHGFAGFPVDIPSDVDCICAQPRKMFESLIDLAGVQLVQLLQHESTAYYGVAAAWQEGRPVFVQVDASSDYRRDGCIVCSGKDVLANARFHNSFRVPAPAHEFAYTLAKRIAKQQFEPQHAARLASLWAEDPSGCRAEAARLLPEALVAQTALAVESGTGLPAPQLTVLRRAMLSRLARGPGSVVRYWIPELARVLTRIANPTGLIVAFLGPDGSGKSSIIERVERDLSPAFRRTRRVHLRPALWRSPRPSAPVSNPHGAPVRGVAASMMKLLYWWFAYAVGYVRELLPAKLRSTLVLFDRYYADVHADPARYRYGGPSWFARWVGAFIPKPDLYIILDAQAEVLQGRKKEVSLEESARQRAAYKRLASVLPHAHLVDTTVSQEDATAAVERIILEHLAMRTARRLRTRGGRT